MSATSQLLFVGCYTHELPHVMPNGSGIETLSYNSDNGRLTKVGPSTPAVNPSWITTNRQSSLLYSVCEHYETQGAAVELWRISGGCLTKEMSVPVNGDWPCHISLSKDERNLLVSNYESGSLVVFRLDEAGRMLGSTTLHQHFGSGPNKDRQKSPHVHQAIPTPDGKRVLVCDAGTDELLLYDNHSLNLEGIDRTVIGTRPGSMPRHAVFSHDGKKLHVIHELGGIISTFAINGEQITLLQEIETVSFPPIDPPDCAEILLHPSGKFVYASNRVNNTISGFTVAQDGMLSLIETWPVSGDHPRSFAFAPDGQHVLIANQNSHTIVVLTVDRITGEIGEIVSEIELGSPACIHFPSRPSERHFLEAVGS